MCRTSLRGSSFRKAAKLIALQLAMLANWPKGWEGHREDFACFPTLQMTRVMSKHDVIVGMTEKRLYRSKASTDDDS